jgi:hypothetical protein
MTFALALDDLNRSLRRRRGLDLLNVKAQHGLRLATWLSLLAGSRPRPVNLPHFHREARLDRHQLTTRSVAGS